MVRDINTRLFREVCKCEEKTVQDLINNGADVNAIDEDGGTPLFYAVWNENEKIIQKLVKCGADINASDNDGKTALFYAVWRENESMVEKLIKNGADITASDKNGRSSLHYAVWKEKERMVKKLIDCGADINATDEDGKTALFFAVEKQNEKIVDKLIKRGADINATNKNGRTVLFFAVWNENEKMVEKLIKFGADVHAANKYGKTALFYAVNKENKNIIRKLIKCGADVNAIDKDGRSPLFYAVQNKNVSVARAIIDGGADVNLTDNERKTALNYAVQWNNESVVRALIDAGADVNLTDNDGKTLFFALFYAVEKRNEKIVDKLIERGVDINATNTNGRTVLLFAVLNENEKMVEKLINCAADVNAIDKDGRSPLFYAVRQSNNESVARAIIDGGADVNVTDNEGKTALFYAVRQSNNESVVRALIYAGADVNVTDNEGETGLSVYAVQWNHESVVRALIDAALELPQRLIKLDDNPNSTDSNGNTALHHATQLAFHGVTQESVLEICQHLQRIDVSFNITNHQNETPLLYCLTKTIEKVSKEEELWPPVKTQAAVCRFLVEHGSSVEAKTGSGETVLHLTVKLLQQGFFKHNSELRKDFSDVALELLKVIVLAFKRQAVSINTQDDSGNSPLHLWAKLELPPGQDYSTINAKGQTFKELVRTSLDLILQDQEQLNSKNRNGETPLQLCRTCSAVEALINAGVNPNDVDSLGRTRLHYCCRNIVEASKSLSIEEIKATAVDWSMIKLLRSLGADYRITDGENQSCLDIAWEFPAIKELLKGPIDLDRLPVRIKPWKSVSKKHERCLAEVARHLESEHLESYWYHKDQLASGSFGDVFAAMNEKDGREVAIKRMVKKSIVRPEDKREITSLTALADCEQVVNYVHYFEDKNFSYIVLELAEGNLDALLDYTITEDIRIELCQDVVKGLVYLHNQNILHRDLKATNILYKWHPKLCLKIADFGLSRRIDSTSTTVYGTNAGTRCWIAPEVLTSTKPHSKSSDMFACGLVLHYILSVKTHPFAPRIRALQHETEANISKGNMEGWDDSLRPEAAHLVKTMLDKDESKRPAADKALDHPFFWSKKKKVDLLNAVGNQQEFGFPRAKRTRRLTAVETDLEKSFGTIVKYVDWNDPGYVHMPAIYTEMTRKRKYDTNSVVELVRFIRNAYAHVAALPKLIQDQLLKHFVFLEYFPNLVMEVYKAVTTHGWDQTRKEIEHALR